MENQQAASQFTPRLFTADEIIKLSSEKTIKLRQAYRKTKPYPGMEADIDFVFSCATDKIKNVWEKCSDNLYRLAAVSEEVRKRILCIMKDGSAHDKLVMICSVRKTVDGMPLDIHFVKQVVTCAILDKADKVKIFGAIRANDMSFYDLADIIHAETQKTSSRKVRENLNYCYTLLTQGYIITTEHNKKLININGFCEILTDYPDNEAELNAYILKKYARHERIRDIYGLHRRHQAP